MIQLRFDGGTELVQALAQLSPRVGKRVQREALEESAEPIRKAMATLAPRRPPHPDMADNILIRPSRGTDAHETAVAIGPAKRFFYASFQEFGTSVHAAQPFARPAFDANWQKSLGLLSAALWRELAGRGIQRRMLTAPVASVSGEEL